MDTLTYWNGTWHEGNPAILGPRDHAFWLGSMVFDGGRAFEGCGPDLDLHAERVVRSARALGLKPTKTAKEILALMHEAVRRFGPKAELYVRPMFWAMKGGAGPISVDGDSTQFLLCVYLAPMRAGTPLTLGLCRSIRRPTPESAPTDAKASCLYPNSSRGVAEMLTRGFQNGIVLDAAGNVAETCSSNLFLAKNGVVSTPVPNGTFLAGITRNRGEAAAQRRRDGRGAHGDHGRSRRLRRDVHHRQCRQGPAGQPLRKPRSAARPDRPPGT
jgi:branched-chain amino acid aminotransferase